MKAACCNHPDHAQDGLWKMLTVELQTQLCARYRTSRQLQASFDDWEEAWSVVVTTRSEETDDAEAGLRTDDLFAWKEKVTKKVAAVRRQRIKERLLVPALPAGVEDRAERAQETFEDLTRSQIVLERNVRKTSLFKPKDGLLDPDESKQSKEEKEAARWAKMLAVYIKEADLPVVKIVEATQNPGETWRRIFGSRRAKTLRNRARSWGRFKSWLTAIYGTPFPQKPEVMIDYLQSRAAEPCGPTTISAAMASLNVLERVGRVKEEDLISTNASVQGVAKNLTMELLGRARPTQHAQNLTVAMVAGLELMVVDKDGVPTYLRAFAFVVLLMIWGAMRSDDVLAISADRLRLSPLGISGVLTRTKTTGPGKKMREVPFYVAREATLTGEDWQKEGMAIWCNYPFDYHRDYFVMEPNKDWSGIRRKMLSVAGVNTMLRKVITMIPKCNTWAAERILFDHKDAAVWTGHSPRHWLVSVAAAVGIPKEKRDFAGRWGVKGESNDYVLTSRQVVTEVQRRVTCCLLTEQWEGKTFVYTEAELLVALQERARRIGVEWVNSHRNLEEGMDGGWISVRKFPLSEQFTLEGEEGETQGASVPLDPTEGVEEVRAQRSPESPFLVIIHRKSGFRRLHKRWGCHVIASQHEVEDVWKITPGVADAVCKLCQKLIPEVTSVGGDEEGSSTSGSSSSSEESERGA